MVEILVPITMFATIPLIVWTVSHFNFKKRQTVHETLRHALDKGQGLTPEMMEKMSLLNDPVRADLRRGVLFLAFGAAFAVLGLVVGQEEAEAVIPMLGVATFPVFLGLAYLGLWAFTRGSRA